MTNKEAIKYLQQLYPNGGHCWLDEQRMEAIGMAVKALQEEPVSEFLNTESMIESYKQRLISQANCVKNSPLIDMCLASYKHGINEILDTLNLSNVEQTAKNWKEEPVSEELEKAAQEYVTKEGYLAGLHYNSMIRSFKAGAEWYASHNTKLPDNLLLAARKAAIDMCNIDDKHLDEYPYHPIAEQKFIEGAKWQKENLWKPADGDDLPEIDREVIVLVKYNAQHNIHDEEYPTYRVGFGHRPDPKGWEGKSVTTGKVEHYTPKTYDKGGWNIPNVVYWLDVKLPKEIEL